MKKYLILLIAVFLPMWICAEPVDVETARQNATDFLRNHSSARGKDKMPANKPLRLLHTQRQDNDDAPTLYVFGNEGGEGYVVVAGDDVSTSTVLGYSKTGTFNAEIIPDNLRYWLDEYSKQLALARKSPSSVKRAPSSMSRESISPLITSKWGQRTPFNNLCPIDPYRGGRCATGCVATAMAQIMHYHKWPEQGIGSHSYEWEGQTLSADFGATTYQWDKMKDTYNEDSSDPDNAVAILMYHIGVAFDTGYCEGNSTVLYVISDYESSSDVLVNYFNYSNSITTIGRSERANLGNEDIIYNELCAKRPVYVSGGEHAFICDGYEDGYFHFNFGWNGDCDDYYLLYAINPDVYDFSNGGEIVYRIKKPGNEYTANGVLYELYSDGTAFIVQGKVKDDFTIPSSIQVNGLDYEVTTIGRMAFMNCSELTSVTIPSSVTSIGDHAFQYCGNLISVDIPSSVTDIGNHAFAYSGLTSVTIPNSVTSITPWTFYGCGSLTSVNIPNSVTSIGEYAFSGCYGLTSVDIPNSVTSIDQEAFSHCDGLTSPVYNSTLFVHMPPSYNGDYIIPDGITTVCADAFSGCTGLTSISISNGVKTIGDWAFEGCSNLTSLSIPNNVTSIGRGAFQNCNGLTSIQIESGNTVYDSRENCNAIIETASNTLIKGCRNTIIPNSITSIGSSAFAFCNGMTSMTIPNSVTYIGNQAFFSCEELVSINIPNSIIEIDGAAFEKCKSLKSVIIPSSLTYINYGVFSGCSNITSIQVESGNTVYDSRWDCNAIIETASNTLIYGCKNTIIPRSVKSVRTLAFVGCSGLKDLYCLAKDVPVTDVDAFVDTDLANATLYVPLSSIENYKSAEPWSLFGNVVALPAEMDLISGDVTGSGNVDVQDATIIVNFILGKENSDEYDFSLADMNNDGEVDVFDVTAILNVILSNGSNSSLARSFTRKDEVREPISLTTERNGWQLGIDSPERFTSFQFDIEVSRGVDLLDVEWNGYTNHLLQFAKNGENRYTVVALSLASTPLPAFDDALLRLHLSDRGEVRIDNVLFVTPAGKAARFNGATTGMTTGIKGISNIQGEQIYDISGRRLNTEREQLSKGVYIINNKIVVIK